MKLLGGDQWKPILQIEAHLIAEHTESARARAVALARAPVAYVPQKLQVLPHPETS
jgi:hypothetical protein